MKSRNLQKRGGKSCLDGNLNLGAKKRGIQDAPSILREKGSHWFDDSLSNLNMK